jgi:hypothetical protein
MSSQAVSFRLEFPSRRQLQSAADPSSDAFQLRVRAQVAASLTSPIPEGNVQVSSTSVARVLEVSIFGFESRSVTPAQVVADTASSRFLAAVSNGLGYTVNMKVAPAIVVRLTSVPSPPPALPPAPPMPSNANANALSQSSESGSVLGGQMIWMVIGGLVGIMTAVGCAVAFCCGKRSGKTRSVQVGRPALRRQVSPEDQQRTAEAALPPLGEPAVVSVRPADVRLLELGMAIERAQGNFVSTSKKPAPHEDAAIKIDSKQVELAIDESCESISPHSERPPTPPPRSIRTDELSPRHLVETRIRASASLYGNL